MRPTDEEFALISGGIAGASFVALAQLVTRGTVDERHLWAIRAFAAATPPAIAVLMWVTRFPGSRRKIPVYICVGVGIAAASLLFVAGVGCLFWALDSSALVIFGVITVICLVAWFVGSCYEYTPEELKWPPSWALRSSRRANKAQSSADEEVIPASSAAAGDSSRVDAHEERSVP
jgi:hypothetical protein